MVVLSASGEPFAEVMETHAAVVYLAGGYAFKLKKPVNFGFLDFRSPQAREAACVREVELNRRLASDVYLGVAELRDPSGQLIDHLVMMRRMPAGRRLSTLVRAGEPVTGALRAVARQLAVLHAASPQRTEIVEQGSRDALWRRWEANLSEARALTGSPLDPGTIDEVQQLAERFLAGRQPLFEARMHADRVVDGRLRSKVACGHHAAASASRSGHADSRRRAARHGQVHARRATGRPAWLHGAEQRPYPQGTGGGCARTIVPRCPRRRNLHAGVDRAHLRRVAAPCCCTARQR